MSSRALGTYVVRRTWWGPHRELRAAGKPITGPQTPSFQPGPQLGWFPALSPRGELGPAELGCRLLSPPQSLNQLFCLHGGDRGSGGQGGVDMCRASLGVYGVTPSLSHPAGVSPMSLALPSSFSHRAENPSATSRQLRPKFLNTETPIPQGLCQPPFVQLPAVSEAEFWGSPRESMLWEQVSLLLPRAFSCGVPWG